MAFANFNSPTPLPEQPETIKVTPIHQDTYHHSVVECVPDNIGNLLTVIEGSNWVVDYYSQVLNLDEELAPFNPDQPLAYQQYHLVKKFILKLQGDLSTSFDEPTQTMETVGTALIYPSIKPNNGDAFIADIGDGNAGQFTVTRVTPKSMMSSTVYEIDFTLSRYVTEPLITLLNEKVVNESVMHEDFLLYGKNPIISPQKGILLVNLRKEIKIFFSYWLQRFYSPQYRTILAPLAKPTYDVYLMNALFNVTDEETYKILGDIHYYNCDDGDLLKYRSIWNLLIENSGFGLEYLSKKTKVYPTRNFSTDVLFKSVYYSGISRVVAIADDSAIHTEQVVFGGNKITDSSDTVDWIASTGVFTGEYEVPNALGETYLFTNSFYTGDTANMTHFEKMVYNHLTKNELNSEDISAYIEMLPKASPMEFYYFGLVILILTNLHLRGC